MKLHYDFLVFFMNDMPENKTIDFNDVDDQHQTGIFLVIENILEGDKPEAMDLAVKCMKLLVNDAFRRSDINFKDRRRNTPLHYCCKL